MFTGFLSQSGDKWQRGKQVNMGDVPGFSPVFQDRFPVRQQEVLPVGRRVLLLPATS
jgi:hypothetical protein